MRVAVAGLLALLAAGGCASAPIRFMSIHGATQEKFLEDRRECALEARQTLSGAVANEYGAAASAPEVLTCAAFNSCLAGRGYLRDDERGNLEVPSDDELQCHR